MIDGSTIKITGATGHISWRTQVTLLLPIQAFLTYILLKCGSPTQEEDTAREYISDGLY